MRTIGLKMLSAGALSGFVTTMATGAAGAQTEPAYTVVPAAERLTVGGVFADASLEMKLVMLVLLAAAAGSVAVWSLGLGKVGRADAKGLAGALARLRIVRSAGVPLGCLAAAYVMFASFIGISNVRPAPSLTVVAPGLAEATLAIMLGLLATTVAVICERHLEGRIRRAAA